MPPWPPACCPCSGQSRGHRLRPGPPALRLGLALPAPRLCPSPRSAPGAERGGSAGPARCPQRAAPPGAEQRLCEGEGGVNGARRLRARPAGDLSSHKAALLGQPGRRGGVGGAAVRLIHLSGENDGIAVARADRGGGRREGHRPRRRSETRRCGTEGRAGLKAPFCAVSHRVLPLLSPKLCASRCLLRVVMLPRSNLRNADEV